MFQNLDVLPADPILGLNQTFKKDPNPDKINLSIGVYLDESGNTPIFSAVKKAEQRLFEKQISKTYIAQQGDTDFLSGITELLLGRELMDTVQGRVATVMTPGGCGALRMGAELLTDSRDAVTVWVSDPTWANHYPLLQSAGLQLKKYAYYDKQSGTVDFEKMMQSLSDVPHGDVILLHGCCHNPTGADISHPQWDQLIDLLTERNLLPYIDIAYQGFSESLEADAYGIRRAVEKLPEVLVASSCSKNFGLYRERTGAVMVITESAEKTKAAETHILASARKAYSMAPSHGGELAGIVLSDEALRQEWMTELDQVKNRMNGLRLALVQGLNAAQSVKDFSFLEKSRGMFCYLGIAEEDVLKLRSEYGIYLLNSTRINVAGLSETNLPIIIDRIATVIQKTAAS